MSQEQPEENVPTEEGEEREVSRGEFLAAFDSAVDVLMEHPHGFTTKQLGDYLAQHHDIPHDYATPQRLSWWLEQKATSGKTDVVKQEGSVNRYVKPELDPTARVGDQGAEKSSAAHAASEHTEEDMKTENGNGEQNGNGNKLPKRGGLSLDDPASENTVGAEHARQTAGKIIPPSPKGKERTTAADYGDPDETDLRIRRMIRLRGRIDETQQTAMAKAKLGGGFPYDFTHNSARQIADADMGRFNTAYAKLQEAAEECGVVAKQETQHQVHQLIAAASAEQLATVARTGKAPRDLKDLTFQRLDRMPAARMKEILRLLQGAGVKLPELGDETQQRDQPKELVARSATTSSDGGTAELAAEQPGTEEGAEQAAATLPDDATLEGIQERCRELNAEKLELERRNGALVEELRTIGNKCDSSQAEVETLKGAYTTAQQQLQDADTIRHDLATQVAEHERTIADLRRELALQPTVADVDPLLVDLCQLVNTSPVTVEALRERSVKLLAAEAELQALHQRLIDEQLQRQKELDDLHKEVKATKVREVPGWLIKDLASFGLNTEEFDHDQLNRALKALAMKFVELRDFHRQHQEHRNVTQPLNPPPTAQPIPVAATPPVIPPSRSRRVGMWLRSNRGRVVKRIGGVAAILVVGLIIAALIYSNRDRLFDTSATTASSDQAANQGASTASSQEQPAPATGQSSTTPATTPTEEGGGTETVTPVEPETVVAETAMEKKMREYRAWRETYRARHQRLDKELNPPQP